MSISGESKYRLLVEAITDYAIYYLEPDGRITSWNAGAERCYGLSAAQAMGDNFARFYTSEDRAAGLPAQALEAAVRDGRHESHGWRLHSDGSRFWAQVVLDPIRDESDGHLVGFAAIARDSSKGQPAEEALRRSQEQLRLLVQGVRDYAIYMLDPDGCVASWNAGAERIKGYREEEVLGKYFGNFYAEQDASLGQPARNLAIAREKGVYEGEGWRTRKDGTRFWAHVVIDRLTDDNGKVVGFAKITRDVTEKKQAEDELLATREALFQSQKTESIGQLTGGVAHDFNNLLMAVMGNLELLRKWLPSAPRPQMLLDNALAGAQRGAALTQRMLAFARRQELHPRPVELPLLVHGMADLLRRSLGPEIRIGTSFPLQLPKVLIDSNQMELALLNLAVNGRDAMSGGGRLEIGARGEYVAEGHSTALPPGEYVCLWVADEGHGMDNATINRATEPFFTTKGVGKGTGLGLSMAYGLAEQSGGRLLLQSQPGRGTTVEIWLPVAAAHADAQQPAAAGDPQDEGELQASEPLSLLLVDDDDLVLLSTMAMAEDMGYDVHGVLSAEEALAFIDAGGQVDVVVTDQAMPGMPGSRLARHLRERNPGLPIVLASGYAELPMDLVPDLVRLGKPFNKRDLYRAISDAQGQVGVTDEIG
ncbi:hybrid sensor histidine kinase/response regulator [Frateuria hangzhouensis]|uniref:hybrid sensor histidine kinase/response regulator n=1 Tax=Frateuria hangzhouensis TaxID=2995589 RepID=UPI00226103B1|nr:PAS domain-containing sensor histidine kinase [Frateuria sp. STR12]MCX7514394.1 PAS domain S-box protein [Frateuria sp. STR12]